jgi:hypothetical protein
MDDRRFDKTTQGHEEITQGRKTLRGKLRTVLFLVDTSKTADEIQGQIRLIGAPADALALLEADGYIRPVAKSGAGPATPVAALAPAEAASVSEPGDALRSFRVAKAFMRDTAVDALGIRAFALTLRMERCATLADLEALLPDFAVALSKKLDTNAVHALVERAKDLASAGRS